MQQGWFRSAQHSVDGGELLLKPDLDSLTCCLERTPESLQYKLAMKWVYPYISLCICGAHKPAHGL